MVKTGLMLGIVLLGGCTAASNPARPAAARTPPVTVPHVEIAFPRLIERYCSSVSERPPDPGVIRAIERRLPDLIALWQRDGPPLLEQARRVTGRPYHFTEAQAVVHGCEDLGSLSQPLLIAAGFYTAEWEGRPPTSDGRPRRRRADSEFVNSVWHEVTHRYLSRIIAELPGGTTPARERHKAESQVVRNHIHLFALEELVYSRLGRRSEFELVRSRVLERGDPELQQAYRIVAAEGADSLISELRPTR